MKFKLLSMVIFITLVSCSEPPKDSDIPSDNAAAVEYCNDKPESVLCQL